MPLPLRPHSRRRRHVPLCRLVLRPTHPHLRVRPPLSRAHAPLVKQSTLTFYMDPRLSAPKLVPSGHTVCNPCHPRRARTPLRPVFASPAANYSPRVAPRALPTTLADGRVRQRRAQGCHPRVTASRRYSPRWPSDRPRSVCAIRLIGPCCLIRVSCSSEVRAAGRGAHNRYSASLESDLDTGIRDSKREREGRHNMLEGRVRGDGC